MTNSSSKQSSSCCSNNSIATYREARGLSGIRILDLIFQKEADLPLELPKIRLFLDLHTAVHILRSIIQCIYIYIYIPSPLLLFAILLSCSSYSVVVNSDPGSHVHVAGSSPPSPVRFAPCIFFTRRYHSALSSLVHSRRIDCADAHDIKQAISAVAVDHPFLFLRIYSVDPGTIQGSHRPIPFIRTKHKNTRERFFFFCETEY